MGLFWTYASHMNRGAKWRSMGVWRLSGLSRVLIKVPSYQYMISSCGDKTVLKYSYRYDGIPYTGKMAYIHWIRPLIDNRKIKWFILTNCSVVSLYRVIGFAHSLLFHKITEFSLHISWLGSWIIYLRIIAQHALAIYNNKKLVRILRNSCHIP